MTTKRSLIISALILAVMVMLPSEPFAAGNDVAIRAFADRKTILIGDKVRFTIEISARKGTDVELPKFADGRMGEFEIKDTGQRMRNRLFGSRTFQTWYALTAYEAGRKEIPGIDVKYRTKGAKDWVLKKTAPISIAITSVLSKNAATLDIKDIKGPLSTHNPYWGIIALFVALVLSLAVTGIFYSRIRRYKPVRLAHETALEELEAIRASFLQGGDLKIYYVAVSDCVRRYIENAFKMKAPEMTTEEFLDSLRDSTRLTMEQKHLLRGFLSACDMVKFAKYTPSHGEAQALYLTAKNFIEETRQKVQNVRV